MTHGLFMVQQENNVCLHEKRNKTKKEKRLRSQCGTNLISKPAEKKKKEEGKHKTNYVKVDKLSLSECRKVHFSASLRAE